MRRVACGLTLALLAVSAGQILAAPLTILYTNDLHLRFDRLESLGAMIDAERATGEPLLLLDAGDAWQDTRVPYGFVWGADEMVEWMNSVRYDAMALGNHEMYWGPARLDELAAAANFPMLCSNLVPTARWAAPFIPRFLMEIGGLRILLIGAVTRYHLPYPDFPWLRYIDPAEAIRRVLDDSEDPYDLLIALGHVSTRRAIEIVQSVPEIDLFVTGHSHEETIEPIRRGESLIVQAGAFARKLGRLRLDVADGVASVVSNELLSTETASVDWDRGRQALAGVVLALLAATLLVLL